MPTEAWDGLAALKPSLAIVGLALLWTWETLVPLAAGRPKRWQHAGRNIAMALLNTLVLGLVFGTATVAVAAWADQQQLGALHQMQLAGLGRLLVAILVLDGWLYVWHRLNHQLPWLWRFHRMHHSDRQMDVTTATRFHVGEHILAAALRLALIPIAGLSAVDILIYETLVVLVTQFHHANISLGALDRPLRWLIVTPRMHQVHHSRRHFETNSNYSVLFSFWDRLAGTYRQRPDSELIDLGLDEFADDHWQTIRGMFETPFVNRVDDTLTPSEKPPETAVGDRSG